LDCRSSRIAIPGIDRLGNGAFSQTRTSTDDNLSIMTLPSALLVVLHLLLAPAPTNAQAAKVISWTDAPGDWDVPLVVVDPTRQGAGLAAYQAAAELLPRPPGQRVLMILGLFMRGNIPRDPESVLTQGIRVEPDRTWCREMFASLKQRGVTLDRLVLDMEDGVSVWHFFGKDMPPERRATLFRPVFERPELRAKLPAELLAFAPEDFASHVGRGREAYLAWDRFSGEITQAALREAVLDPARATFGEQLPVSNYQDTNPARAIRDLNGWPMGGALTRERSSPELYLWIGNDHRGRKKDPRWNRLIQCLNVARACLATPGQHVEPWVSSPGFTGDESPPFRDRWLWEQLVRHLSASGVSTFLFFNPRPPPADREGSRHWEEDMTFAAELFRALPAPEPRRDLPEIPYDSDVIETGELRTTYAEFIRRYPTPTSLGEPER
jgi:hypothetical protein